MGLFTPSIDKLVEEGDWEKVAKLLKHKKPEIRKEAFLILLGKIREHTDPVYEQLRAMMNDSDPGIRTIAVLKFAERGEEGLYEKVHSIILDGSQRDKIDALRVLANRGYGENEAITQVLVLALHDKKPLVQIEAIRTMGSLKDKLSIQHLQRCSYDIRHTIRLEAVKSLGIIGGDEVVDVLIGALMDNNSTVRNAARDALEHMDSEKAQKAYNDAPLMLLVKLMNEGMSKRLDTIRYIASKKLLEGIPLLQKACNDEYKNIRIEAIRALGILRDRGSISLISDLLNDTYYDVRMEAIKTLEKLGTSLSLHALEKALEDHNTNVRKEASRAYYALKVRLDYKEETEK